MVAGSIAFPGFGGSRHLLFLKDRCNIFFPLRLVLNLMGFHVPWLSFRVKALDKTE